MQIVLTLLVIILFALSGLALWASAERPLALREIALNTRREASDGPDYVYLKLLSVLRKVFAVLVWNAGLLLVIYINLVELPAFF